MITSSKLRRSCRLRLFQRLAFANAGMTLPASWRDAISPYLPSHAGGAITQTGHPANTLGPWTDLGVLAGYAALPIAIAAVQLRRRDV